MAFSVKYSKQAEDDFDEIICYISDELSNPPAAENFYGAVSEKLVLLRDNPYIYPLHHDETLQAVGYRFAAIGNYLLFYTVDKKSSTVNIVRIVYGRRELSAALENE